MTKIVYNACYGGFGLSEKAMQRYGEIKGWVCKKTGDRYQFDVVINEMGDEISDWDLDKDRTDPVLIQVIEELGEEANGYASKLRIAELEPGTLYRIDEYDGYESVCTKDDYDWKMA